MTLLKGRTFIVLIILMIFFSITANNFLTVGSLLTVAKHVALYGILAIGMTYVIITGGIDLSVGSVAGLAGMIAGGLIQEGLTLKSMWHHLLQPLVPCTSAVALQIFVLMVRHSPILADMKDLEIQDLKCLDVTLQEL